MRVHVVQLPTRRIVWRLLVLFGFSFLVSWGLQGLRVFTLLSTTGIFVALSCASLVGQCHVSGFWIRLPKRVSQRLVSFAALLYWGLGWLVPLAGYLIAAFQQPPLSRAEQALVVGLTGLLAASAYALLIEPRWVVARNLVLPYAGLPTPLDGLRILHLSDLHFPLPRPTVRRMRHLIRQLSPDLICVTGDLANDARSDSGHGLLQCRQFLGSLTPPRGMFLVWGDWDGVAKGWREFEQAISTDRQVFILNDALRRIWVHQTPVVIMGRAPAHLDAQTNYMQQLPREGFRIVLHHYPFGALRAAELGVDLYLAGDTHGGQAVLPLAGFAYRSAKSFLDRRGEKLPPQFIGGLHRLGRTWVHVSRGIGTRGGDAPPIRFCCRPEITMLTLTRE